MHRASQAERQEAGVTGPRVGRVRRPSFVRFVSALEPEMKQHTPAEAMRIDAARRYLKQAEAELEAAGENLTAMRVGALVRGLR